MSNSKTWRCGAYVWGISLVLLAVGACAPAVTKTLPPVAVTVYRAGSPTPGGEAITPTPLPPAETPTPQLGPDTFPENVNPLTGETVDLAKLNRIPIAIKISNFPYSVRPQFGLSLAD